METEMTDAKKPAWVEALDEAKAALSVAAQGDPEAMNSGTRLAYAWMDVAKLLKDC